MSASALSMLSLGTGSSGKEQVGQLKLPLLPKDESQFFLWKMKVQSTIEGIGSIEVIQYPEAELLRIIEFRDTRTHAHKSVTVRNNP